MLEDDNEEVSPMFKYIIYAILIICVLGFVYFIYNWIKCFLSRPQDVEEDSEEDDESYDPSKAKQKQMEMKHVIK